MSSERTADRRFEPAPIGSRSCNVEDHGPNNHLTLIYEDRDEQFATAIPFIKQGLEQGEKCLYVADDNSVESVKRAMRETGIDVEAAVQSGLLCLRSAPDVFLEDGEFDPDGMIEFLDDTVTETIEEEGFEHVRITGEMTWVLNGEEHFGALADYEEKLNRFYPEKSVTGLCQYNREQFPSQVLHNVIRTHPQVVYEDTLTQNFFYAPPSKLFEDDAESDIDQRVETLLRQARAEHEVAEYEQGLAALTDASRELSAGTTDDVTAYAVRNVEALLDSVHAAVCDYDADERRLRTRTAVHDADAFDPDRHQSDLWEAFVTNESRVVDDVRPEAAGDGATRSLLVVPLGRHGVLVAGSPERSAFSESDLDFAETVGANVRAALDRTEQRAVLSDREQTIREQDDVIRRLERVTALVRDVARVLTKSSTRAEITEAVCDRLSRTEPYQFVWFGERDVTSGGLSPTDSAGFSRGYLDDVEVSEGGPRSDGVEPSLRAAETEETQVVSDVFASTPVHPWQREAFRRGFHSIIAVPVTYDDVSYGVLTVYAGEPDAFDELERSVLSELGETVGFALNAVERKQALVDDRVVELELRITDPEFPAIDFARKTGATFDFHGVVPTDDGFRVFAALRGCSEAEMRSYVAESLVVTSAAVVADREDGLLVEYAVRDAGFVAKLLAHGAEPSRITADAESAEAVVSLPSTKDATAFLEMLRRTYSGVELTAKRARERERDTVEHFQSDLETVLTPRQRETLRTAYYSGYFDQPRARTGEEIAERMGVSQPTFNRHIREASRRLFWRLFEDGHARE